MVAKRTKVTWVIMMAAILILGLMGMARAMELKFAHTAAPSSSHHEATLKFAELVEKKTGGALKVTVYPAGQLGNDTQMLQGVRLGSIDIGMTGMPWHSSFAPLLNVMDLPFIFRDFDHVYRVMDGEIGQELLSKALEPHGMKGLGFMEAGWRHLTNSKRPVKVPEDVKGLKIRTTANPYHVTAWNLVGAISTPISWTELYMALKTGTVDGQENPISLIHSAKLFEVQKYMSFTAHAWIVLGVDMNLKKYQGLPSSQQKALIESCREAGIYVRNLNRKGEEPWLKEMKQKGLMIIENPDREAFAKVMAKKVQEDFAKKFGWEMIEKISQVK